MLGTLSNRRGLKRAITPEQWRLDCEQLKLRPGGLKKGQLTCALQSFNVLGALGKLSDGLHEGDSGFLVRLKWGEDCS